MSEDKIKTDDELFRSFMDAFVHARGAGKWMAAVWEVRGNQITMVNLTTSQFPRGDYLRALGQLTDRLTSDTADAGDAGNAPSGPELPEKLPTADLQAPDIKVFPLEDPAEEAPKEEQKVPAVGFPVPTPLTAEQIQENLKKLPEVIVLRTEHAVVVHAEGVLPGEG